MPPQPSPFQPPCLEIQTTARANSPASTRMVMIPRSVSIEKTSLFALECAISVYTILRKRAIASQWEKIAKKSKLGLEPITVIGCKISISFTKQLDKYLDGGISCKPI